MPAAGDEVVVLHGGSAETLLERLAAENAWARDDLMGGVNVAGGSGGQLGRFVELDGEFLKTNLDCRYATAEEAVGHELPREQLRRELGVYHPERVFFVSRGADGAFWACSLTPRLPTLRELFNRQVHGGAVLRTNAWKVYLEAFRTTFQLADERSVLLDCNPNNFAVENGRVYYVDDDVIRDGRTAAFVNQALLRLREYPEAPAADRLAFLNSFVALANGYDRTTLRAWGFLADLESGVGWPPEEGLRAVLEELLRHLMSTRRRSS